MIESTNVTLQERDGVRVELTARDNVSIWLEDAGKGVGQAVIISMSPDQAKALVHGLRSAVPSIE